MCEGSVRRGERGEQGPRSELRARRTGLATVPFPRGLKLAQQEPGRRCVGQPARCQRALRGEKRAAGSRRERPGKCSGHPPGPWQEATEGLRRDDGPRLIAYKDS